MGRPFSTPRSTAWALFSCLDNSTVTESCARLHRTVAAGRHVDCRLHEANNSSGKVILHPSAQLWPGHEVRAVQDSRICPAASRKQGNTPPPIASAIAIAFPSRFFSSSARQSPIGRPGSHWPPQAASKQARDEQTFFPALLEAGAGRIRDRPAPLHPI